MPLYQALPVCAGYAPSPICATCISIAKTRDGYHRDQCVFGKDIDIEDTMNVVVRYNTGAFMSYSLNAFLPWEGYRVAFNGTKGRLEHDCVESVYISGDGNVQGATIPSGTKIRLYPHFKPARNITVKVGKGMAVATPR